MEIAPFYLNQEVVANCTYGGIVKGKQYKVHRIGKCSCGASVISVGIEMDPNRSPFQPCIECGGRIPTDGTKLWFYTWRFSPKIEISSFISMESVANVEAFSQN